jgi:hypothetical protein
VTVSAVSAFLLDPQEGSVATGRQPVGRHIRH